MGARGGRRGRGRGERRTVRGRVLGLLCLGRDLVIPNLAPSWMAFEEEAAPLLVPPPFPLVLCSFSFLRFIPPSSFFLFYSPSYNPVSPLSISSPSYSLLFSPTFSLISLHSFLSLFLSLPARALTQRAILPLFASSPPEPD